MSIHEVRQATKARRKEAQHLKTIRFLLRQGLTVNQIASTTGLHPYYVHKLNEVSE